MGRLLHHLGEAIGAFLVVIGLPWAALIAADVLAPETPVIERMK